MKRLAASLVIVFLGGSCAGAEDAGQRPDNGGRYQNESADYAREENRSADYLDAQDDRRRRGDRGDYVGDEHVYGYRDNAYGYGGEYYGHLLGLPFFDRRDYLGFGGRHSRYGYVGKGDRGDQRGGPGHRSRTGAYNPRERYGFGDRRDFDRRGDSRPDRHGGRDFGRSPDRGRSRDGGSFGRGGSRFERGGGRR